MKKTITLTESDLNKMVLDCINQVNERREMLVEMARINKNETGNSIFPFDKWEVKIWSNDHNPPHFHIICDAWNVSFTINDGEVIESKGNGNKQIFDYMVNNVNKWLLSKCASQPKLTNQENAMLVWEQLHENE